MRKKFSWLSFAVAALLSVAYAGTPTTQDKLPKEARSFIVKYFPGDKVRNVEKEQGYRGMEYEVDFASGAEIDFREDGSWKEIKSAKGKVVPIGVVPAGIAKHVKTNYSGQGVVEISRKRGGYEVELADGTELKLTEDGKPFTKAPRNNHRGR